MEISHEGLSLIKRYEALRLSAYDDFSGKTVSPGQPVKCVLTIGYGHIGADVKAGQTITEAQADAWLAQDIKRAVAEVNRLFGSIPRC